MHESLRAMEIFLRATKRKKEAHNENGFHHARERERIGERNLPLALTCAHMRGGEKERGTEGKRGRWRAITEERIISPPQACMHASVRGRGSGR